MMEGGDEGAGLLAAPVEFKRMLSWQLSTPSSAPVAKRRRRRKKSQEAQMLSTSNDPTQSPGDEDEELIDFAPDGDEITADYAYIFVNSDGEEEIYYSAPESPLTSDDEGPGKSPAHPQPDTASVSTNVLPLERQVRKKKSKRSKKKARYLARAAKVEFFQPLCDLVEDRLQVDVGELERPSCAQVPSLAEICIRKIRADSIDLGGENVPFLIHSLLSHDKQQRSSVSTHVRWLERQLAELEKLCTKDLKRRREAIKDGHQPVGSFLGRAFLLQPIWNLDAAINELPNDGEGLHCPLPPVPDMYYPHEGHDSIAVKILLHFANYFFPLFSAKGGRSPPVEMSGSLSRSQLAAIHYVTEFIQSRYKSLSEDWSQFLKVWPGYVYWARGQLKLAANAFVSSLELLKHSNDKACMFNELGRMFLMFGDRSSAGRYFRQSALTAKPDHQNCHNLKEQNMQLSSFTLEAAVWDCGILTPSTAREAARAWALVLKEASKLSSSLWYFPAAACESRLCFHAGQPVGGEDPSSPLAIASPSLGASHERLTLKWLRECEQLFSSLVSDYPVLNYHLSLVHALSGTKEASRMAWRSFINDYYGFHEWPDWLESNTSIHLFSTQGHAPRHPWQPLLSMLSEQKLKCAPVMAVHWRVRLLQPYYPYYASSIWKLMLGDHCATPPGLRLSYDGYLTADINLDMPPMRCLLIDPYTGSLQFSRSASLQHYNLNQFQRPVLMPQAPIQRCYDHFALPWPLRLLETDQCIVELQMTSTIDLEAQYDGCHSNYHASMTWCGQDGTQSRLDIRKHIRKQLKQSILELAEKMEVTEKEDGLLDRLMEHGRHVTVKDLKEAFVPKYAIHCDKKSGSKTKHRDYRVYDFSLQLTYRVVYGDATVCLCFDLAPYQSGRTSLEGIYGQALVFVDCSSAESFTKPKIYCVGDEYGFQLIYPSPTHCSAYQGYHLRHLNYIMAVRTESVQIGKRSSQKLVHTQMVFDRTGATVHSDEVVGLLNPGHRQYEIKTKHLDYQLCLGNRLFACTMQDGSTNVQVFHYNLTGKNKCESHPLKANSIKKFTSIPGLLLLHTNKGVALLHPGTLELIKVELKGSTHEAAGDGGGGEDVQYQFSVEEALFSVVKVWDVESFLNNATDANEDSTEGTSDSDDVDHKLDPSSVDFGSCVAAITVNDRLLVIRTQHRSANVSVLLDIILPGKTTEVHSMGNSGYILSVTQFPDNFREEVYWLSESGKLLGVLPSVGKGPHGFFSATLSPRSSSSLHERRVDVTLKDDTSCDNDNDDCGGLYVFFNDGMGGIVCLRPTV